MTIQTIPRRLPEVGRLRLGQKVPAGNGTRPAALDTWRLTSKSRFRLEAAAKVYGGTVQQWADAPGEDPQWELFTDAKALRVAVVPTIPVSQFYEHWTGGGCQRRCDGQTELLSGDGCLCFTEADDPTDYKCKPTTRLSVLLPDLPGLGVWRVETHGYYGAAELAASAELLASFGRPMPVALIIDQRSEKRPGQPRRDYVVPMLDSRQSFLDLQALAAADPVTGEIGPAPTPAVPFPAIESSGSDPATSPAGPSDPDPTSGGSRPSNLGTDTDASPPGTNRPSTPTPASEAPTETDRAGVEGGDANHASQPGAGEGPPPPDTNKAPDGSATPPGRPSGAARSGRGRSSGKAAAPAGTDEPPGWEP